MNTVANENKISGAKPSDDPIRINLTVTREDGSWKWVFSGPKAVVLDSEGILKFTGFKGTVNVEIVLVASPGVFFLSNAEHCVAFAKDTCPVTSDKKDTDVFRKICVSDNLDTLSFTNHNTKGLFYYALFVNAGGADECHDPIIINKNN